MSPNARPTKPNDSQNSPPPAARPPSKEWLEGLYCTHHRLENLYPDPLVFARGFADPADGELAGLVAAVFAYGQVGKILEALGRVFQITGNSLSSYLKSYRCAEALEALADFRYRFHKGADVALFFHLVRQALDARGGLGELFVRGDPGGDLGGALTAFADGLLAGDARPVLRTRRVPEGHPVRFLLASPGKGGAAKRLCLFLRWMVRADALDPGYWGGRVDPARLVIPLDTHVAWVGRVLGFSRRAAADWKSAREITEALKRYDPADPVRYDFSLFRFGMTRAGAPDAVEPSCFS